MRGLAFLVGAVVLSVLARRPAPHRRGSHAVRHEMAPDLSPLQLPPVSLPAVAAGAAAIGALAVGALAIGALAIGRLEIRKARLREVEIDDLTVRRFRVVEEPDEGSAA